MSRSDITLFSSRWWMEVSAQLLLFLIGFVVVYPLGFRGFMALDQSIVLEAGGRIFYGQRMFLDFYLPFGIVPAYLQAFFFMLFGVSWKTYVIHACFINGLTAVLVYRFMSAATRYPAWLNYFVALYTTLVFYTVPGTPYPENHAQFFCLLAGFTLILAHEGKYKYLRFFPVLMLLAFFSKQSPTLYYVIFYLGWIIFNFRYFRSYYREFLWSFLPLGIVLLYPLLSWNLTLFRFYFIELPSSLGGERYENVNLYHMRLFFGYLRDGAKYFFWAIPLAIPALIDLRNRRSTTAFIWGIGLLLISLLGILTSNNQPENMYPFLTLGAFLVIYPLFEWVKEKSHVAALWGPLLLLPITLLFVKQRYDFIVKRKFHDIVFDYGRQNDWLSKTTGIYLRQQVAFGHKEDYDALYRFLKEKDENFIWFGDAACFSTLIGNVSPMPLIFYHQGLSYPDPEIYPESFSRLREKISLAMDTEKTRYVVIENDKTYMSATVNQFWDGILTDTLEVGRFGSARVLEINRPEF